MEPTNDAEASSSRRIFEDFLLTDSTFRKLRALQVQGWESKEGDKHWEKKRSRIFNIDRRFKQRMFHMMEDIAKEMDQEAFAFTCLSSPSSPLDTPPSALDLCMAPGGFVSYFLTKFPHAKIDAITLPEEQGGLEVLLDARARLKMSVVYADVTMFSGGMCTDAIPTDHPEAQKFELTWPYAGHAYDLVLCDGQFLRTHDVAQYRKLCEPTRLACAQLFRALESVRPGGTIVALMHASQKFRSFNLLRSFSKIADIKLFKSERYHKETNAFYLIASNVQLFKKEAGDLMEDLRQSWLRNTLENAVERNAGGQEEKENGTREDGEKSQGRGYDFGLTEKDMQSKIEDFGAQYLEMVRPIWEKQAAALENAPWMKSR